MTTETDITGTVFDIQRYTIHDGPGIRTEVFLKGCTLACRWCSNPESIHPGPEIACHPSRCIGTQVCRQCMDTCPAEPHPALVVREDTLLGIDRDICTNCLHCADACPADALTVYGRKMTAAQVLTAVLADRAYYHPVGGVTFSGGEPFVQHRFLMACLAACRSEGIHTCVESALAFPGEHLSKALPLMDLIIFDLKVMEEQRHRDYTGRGNRQILENAVMLGRSGIPMIVRIPIIPGHNDDRDNLATTARFIKERLGDKVLQVQLLRYRPLGLEKYEALGRRCPMADHAVPDRETSEAHVRQLAELMQGVGVPAVAGTTTPIPAVSSVQG